MGKKALTIYETYPDLKKVQEKLFELCRRRLEMGRLKYGMLPAPDNKQLVLHIKEEVADIINYLTILVYNLEERGW